MDATWCVDLFAPFRPYFGTVRPLTASGPKMHGSSLVARHAGNHLNRFRRNSKISTILSFTQFVRAGVCSLAFGWWQTCQFLRADRLRLS